MLWHVRTAHRVRTLKEKQTPAEDKALYQMGSEGAGEESFENRQDSSELWVLEMPMRRIPAAVREGGA